MRSLIGKLEGVLERIGGEYGIDYAILFGSYVGRYEFDESDLDVAVKLKKSPENFRKKLRIITKISSEIEKIVGIETDVIVLNDSPPGLRFEIFRKGKTLFISNRRKLIEDKSRTMAEYHDFSMWTKPIFDKMIEGIKYGRE